MNDMVSIVIPCLNEVNLISQCLDSIIHNCYDKAKLEILVVDGMSNDGTRDIIKDYTKKYNYIKLLDNPLKTQQLALNIGIKNSKGDYIIRLDTHATICNNYISRCIKLLKNTGVDAVGGVIKTIPQNESMFAKLVSVVLSSRFGVGNSHFRTLTNTKTFYTDTVPYGCYSKYIYDKIGLYNENMEASEDQEFHFRLKEQGFKILCDPSLANTYHSRAKLNTFWKHNIRNGLWIFLPYIYTKHMNYSIRHFIPFMFIISLIIVILFSVITVHGIYFLYFFCALYLLFALPSSILNLSRCNPKISFLLLPFIYFMLHLSYGLGSILGLFILIRNKIKKSLTWIKNSQ